MGELRHSVLAGLAQRAPIKPQGLADPPLGLFNLAVQRLGRKSDEPGGEVRQQGLEPDALLQLGAQVAVWRSHV